ncbi:MAG TPA: PAAR domain-containing protein [Tahibacter sp.]|jgi:uncharacterized Zn-binding protein involved in type VI secretion|nr:PAAR domain-containing protein [Tahibacter sp.]
MPAPAARIGDNHIRPGAGGPIVGSARRVYIEGRLAARLGDPATCGRGQDVILEGEPSVLIEQRPAARVGDAHGCGGVIESGAGRTFIGETRDAACLQAAAEEAALVVVPESPDYE